MTAQDKRAIRDIALYLLLVAAITAGAVGLARLLVDVAWGWWDLGVM